MNEMIFAMPTDVIGLPERERAMLGKLLNVYSAHISKNIEKEKYYEGKISLSEVNLGIALPLGMRGLEVGCAWGAKAVDVLAARSMFDGFVDGSGRAIDQLDKIVQDNRLVSEYSKACRDELKYGCTFATVTKVDGGAAIRFNSPRTAAAVWDGGKGRVGYGFIITDIKDNFPVSLNLYTDDAVWVIYNDRGVWKAEGYTHRMGRPLMEPLVWNATTTKPFGRSRIKEPIRRLIQGYVRTLADAAIGLEFSTSPQKYILGVTDDQYEQIVGNKFKQYVGSIIASTTNPETGEKPTFGQLTQGNIGPHVEMIRVLATQFSAATGLPVTDTGVVNDANPTSSDAIEAQTKTLVGLAQDLNNGNGDSLRQIALMSLAIANDTNIEGLADDQKDVVAHFRNPSMPSIASTTDAALKLASARKGFADTDVFLEMVGFSPADIRRIKAQEQRSRGMTIFEGITE